MAKRFALVPESMMTADMLAKAPKSGSVSAVSVREIEPELGKVGKLSGMADLLPKNQQNRAKVLLHYLDGKIELNEHDRIVYTDGFIGSYLLDMIRYYVSPFVKTRPLDAPRFESLANEIGIPTTAFARPLDHKSTPEIVNRWKPY